MCIYYASSNDYEGNQGSLRMYNTMELMCNVLVKCNVCEPETIMYAYNCYVKHQRFKKGDLVYL